ncbi:protein PHLOEM PROTEIN 2-LIKE A9-like [Rosa sericea]
MTKPHYQAEKEEIIKEGDGCIIKPRGLNIVWGNDERYWKIPAKGSAGDNDAAELVQVSWLEVTGSVVLTPGKTYKLNFEVQLLSEAFGWTEIQAFLMTKVGKKGRYTWKRVKVQQQAGTDKFLIPKEEDELRIEVPPGNTDNTLQFGLYEVWSGKWKGGLKIYNAQVTAINP